MSRLKYGKSNPPQERTSEFKICQELKNERISLFRTRIGKHPTPFWIQVIAPVFAGVPCVPNIAIDEYDRYHINVRDDMNQLRRELIDYL